MKHCVGHTGHDKRAQLSEQSDQIPDSKVRSTNPTNRGAQYPVVGLVILTTILRSLLTSAGDSPGG